jgi:hypothetical protein
LGEGLAGEETGEERSTVGCMRYTRYKVNKKRVERGNVRRDWSLGMPGRKENRQEKRSKWRHGDGAKVLGTRAEIE